MKSAQSYLVILFALTTVGGAIFSWQQYQELVGLRASALNADDRADLQKRLWEAEKRARALAAELAALAPAAEETAAPGALAGPGEDTASSGNTVRRNRRPPNTPMLGGFAAMMENPEMQKLMALQQRGMLDGTYAALFKNLKLTPEQLDKFKDLLVEKQMAMMDVMAATRAQGINPRTDPEGFRKMLADTQAELDSSIKATLGDSGFNQYQQYQQTFPQRSVVNQLQQSLSYTGTPLSDVQSEQLVRVLAQSAPTRNAPGNNPANAMRLAMPVMLGAGNLAFGGSTTITAEAMNLAQGLLSAPQLQALQQLQQQQQVQQQLQQAMRQNAGGNRGNGTGTTNAIPKTAPKG